MNTALGNFAPPSDVEAEAIVLAHCLLRAEALERVAEALPDAEAFHDQRHRLVYGAMLDCRMAHENVDAQAIAARLKGRESWFEPTDHRTALRFVVALRWRLQEGIALDSALAAVEAKAFYRRAIGTSQAIQAAALASPADVDTFHDFVDGQLHELSAARRDTAEFQPMADAVPEMIAAVDAAYERGGALPGASTTLPDLDAMLGGIVPGDQLIVAARPSVGKTALLVQMAAAAGVETGRPALFASLEMGNLPLVTRLAAALMGVDSMALRCGRLAREQWVDLHATARRLAAMPIVFVRLVPPTPLRLRSAVRLALRKYGGLASVTVDYLQFMQADRPREARHQELDDIAKSTKQDIARALNVAVVMAAATNRKGEDRADKRPVLSDLADCGKIEYHADGIVMLHRQEDESLTEMIVRKSRNGPVGSAWAHFQREYSRFVPAAREDVEAAKRGRGGGKWRTEQQRAPRDADDTPRVPRNGVDFRTRQAGEGRD